MDNRDSPAWTGWLLAVLMFLSACLQTLFEQQHMYRVKVLQMRLRTAITGLVYRKVSPWGKKVCGTHAASSDHHAAFPALLPAGLMRCEPTRRLSQSELFRLSSPSLAFVPQE